MSKLGWLQALLRRPARGRSSSSNHNITTTSNNNNNITSTNNNSNSSKKKPGPAAAFSVRRARRCFAVLCVAVTLPLLALAQAALWCYSGPLLPRAGRQGATPPQSGAGFVHYFPQREFREKAVKTILVWEDGIPLGIRSALAL